MNQYTWEYLAECGEFEHGQTFVTVEDFEKEVVFKQDKIKQLQQELQKTREQLEIATKHISKLLDIESHYEDCSYHSDDDETCDCGNEENYYKPARDFCINVKDKQGE